MMMYTRIETPSTTPCWDENYALLQEYLKENADEIDHNAQESWLVTPNSKINQWLVYNKVELRRPHRQADQCWQERKQRLEALGFQF